MEQTEMEPDQVSERTNRDGNTSPPQSKRAAMGPLRRLQWNVPLGWQLSALYTVLLVVTLSLVGVLVYSQQQDFLVQDAAMRLEQSAARVLATPEARTSPDHGGQQGPGDGGGGRGQGDALHLDILIRSLSGPDVAVALLDPSGTVITSTQSLSGGSAPVVDAVDEQRAASAISSSKAVHWVTQRSNGSRYVVVLMSITRPLSAEFDTAARAQLNNSDTYFLVQSASLAAADAALSRLGLYLLLGVIGGTIAGLVLGTAFTRGVLRPLDRVADTAEAIAAGDLQRRLQLPAGRNEVSRLGKAFDHMVNRLVSTLEAQRRFVADASHELRTPLTSLKGLAEILMIGAHGNNSAVVEQSASAINGELERMIRLVTDLLTLSRFDNVSNEGGPPVRRTQMDVCATVDAAITQMGPLAEARGVHLLGRCDSPVWVSGDPGHLKQVVLNLLDNAVRHTPDGGEVGLSARIDSPMQQAASATARIEVWDTGSGIDPRDLPHIFERFYRSDVSRTRATGNSGLGLSIAKTIVEGHGGSIEVQSMPGAGTRFTIKLPLAQHQMPTDETRPVAAN
ncbi:MAG: HAMP domain-containing sensor histidine kinase [Chloroflexota bacterium]